MSRSVEVRVPDMGDFKNVAIIDVMVKPGDAVEIDTPLITLETDKATMDVPSTSAGVVEKVHAAKGGKISPGDLVITLRADGGAKQPEVSGAAPAAASTSKADAPKAQASATSRAAVAPESAKATEPTPSAPSRERAKPDASSPAPASVEIRVPDMGGFKDVVVIDVLVKPGQSIELDTPLITLETDKATMDVPSTVAGVVEKVHISKDGKVSTGDLVATVRSEGVTAAKPESSKPAAAENAPPQQGQPPTPTIQQVTASAPASVSKAGLPPINEPGFSRAYAGPSVRRLARELGVDLAQVSGTGVKGRIMHDDVKAFVKRALSSGQGATGKALPATPTVDFAKFGPVELKPLSRIQKISGPRLHASWVNIPHVTQFDEADITALEDMRTKLKQKAAQEGIKLTPLAFVMRACVKALLELPQFNASLDAAGENLVFKKYMHIGFAADTPNGLVVPVLQNADRCDIYELARKLAELAEKARSGKLSPGEMQGGTFTISSLGGIGGTAFTPIINAPEVAILGVSRSTIRPVFENGSFVPRTMLPLSLSYDHRAIDGAAGARFTTFLAKTLSDPRSLTEAVP
jgi:pyruvate dehydrogenase E2 component (dihydrolipoamide acetyltransferase)